MNTKGIIITGAFGYSGKVVADDLITRGHKVKTLTNSGHKQNPFGNNIAVSPFNFDKPEVLCEAMKGYDVLINTYWVRFNHASFNHDEAVQNTKILFDAAKKAGIKRIVHVSITNPSIDSDLEYFKGKAELENYLKLTEIEHTIVRPAVLFGRQDILINNIVWMIRKLPLFGVFGKGDYKLQPIHVDDFAHILVREAFAIGNKLVNAIGPETFTYKELVKTAMQIIGKKKPVINVNPEIGYWAGRIVSSLKSDVTITRPEIKGLMDNLLYVDDKPAGKIKLTDWLKENKDIVGTIYSNEIARRK